MTKDRMWLRVWQVRFSIKLCLLSKLDCISYLVRAWKHLNLSSATWSAASYRRSNWARSWLAVKVHWRWLVDSLTRFKMNILSSMIVRWSSRAAENMARSLITNNWSHLIRILSNTEKCSIKSRGGKLPWWHWVVSFKIVVVIHVR